MQLFLIMKFVNKYVNSRLFFKLRLGSPFVSLKFIFEFLGALWTSSCLVWMDLGKMNIEF